MARLAFIGSSITALNDVTLEVQEGMRPLADPLPLEFVREFQASALHIPVPEQFFAGIVNESLKAPARVCQARSTACSRLTTPASSSGSPRADIDPVGRTGRAVRGR